MFATRVGQKIIRLKSKKTSFRIVPLDATLRGKIVVFGEHISPYRIAVSARCWYCCLNKGLSESFEPQSSDAPQLYFWRLITMKRRKRTRFARFYDGLCDAILPILLVCFVCILGWFVKVLSGSGLTSSDMFLAFVAAGTGLAVIVFWVVCTVIRANQLDRHNHRV